MTKPQKPKARRRGNAPKAASRKAASAARESGAANRAIRARILGLTARISVIESFLELRRNDAEEE